MYKHHNYLYEIHIRSQGCDSVNKEEQGALNIKATDARREKQ